MLRRFFLGAVPLPSLYTELSICALRVFAGLAMATAHGLKKVPPPQAFIDGVAQMGFPQPLFFAWSATAAELLGGICLALGLFTRPSAALIAITMGVAGFIRHAPDAFAQKELALMYFFVSIVFVVIGGGRISVDRLLRGQ